MRLRVNKNISNCKKVCTYSEVLQGKKKEKYNNSDSWKFFRSHADRRMKFRIPPSTRERIWGGCGGGGGGGGFNARTRDNGTKETVNLLIV